ncbi:MAG: TolC family protein [Nitrospiraceae bacterium]
MMLLSIFLILLLTGSVSASFAASTEIRTDEPSLPAFELHKIIELSLERNPIMGGAEGSVQQSRGQRVTAGAYLNPSITGQSGRGVVLDPSSGAVISERAVTLSQPLEWLGKRAARQQAAEAGLAGASVGVEEVRLNLIAEVKNAFYELLLAQRAVELAKRNLSIVEDVARVVKARVQSGEGPQFEAIKADVEVMKANQELTRSENAVRVRLVSLDTLTAGALGPSFTIQGDFKSFQQGMKLQDLTARGLAQHPTLRRLEKLVERAAYNVVFEREARIPNVTVQGSYQRDAGREGVIANLTIPMPIWYQRQGEVTTALGAKRQEEAELLRTQNELVRAINQHFQDAETAQKQIELFEQGLLRQAREALRIAQLSFQQGATSLLEVLDAQRVERQILSDYYRARFELSIALTRLERSVGGSL